MSSKNIFLAFCLSLVSVVGLAENWLGEIHVEDYVFTENGEYKVVGIFPNDDFILFNYRHHFGYRTETAQNVASARGESNGIKVGDWVHDTHGGEFKVVGVFPDFSLCLFNQNYVPMFRKASSSLLARNSR